MPLTPPISRIYMNNINRTQTASSRAGKRSFKAMTLEVKVLRFLTILWKAFKTQIPEHVQKEFQVVKLIDDYRTRGHLFTKTNPVRDRRKYTPSLDLENFGLSSSDLDTVFNAGEIIGIGPQSLRVIRQHLEAIYCDAIGVEYMYIRRPNERQWIQDKLNSNDNQGSFSADEKKHILKKLNEAVSFENLFTYKICWSKTIFIGR